MLTDPGVTASGAAGERGTMAGRRREPGRRGFDEYSEMKTIWVNLGVAKPWAPARG
jgi:hypothetical protein